MPSLADGFNARLETAAGLAAALAPGETMVLVPGQLAPEGSLRWVESCGKTQLAVCVAESLWRSQKVELLIWAVASNRASVLSGQIASRRVRCELSSDSWFMRFANADKVQPQNNRLSALALSRC